MTRHVDPERERELRRKFGPAAGQPRRPGPKPRTRWRPSRWEKRLLILWLSILAVGLLVKAMTVLTPGDRVASGCWWWTSRGVTDVAAGYEGCIHGYVVKGGGLAESLDESSYALSFDPGEAQCAFGLGQAVVIRGHAIFADGRTYILVRDCG